MTTQKISIRLLKDKKAPADVLKKNYTASTSPKITGKAELYVDNFQNSNVDWASYLGIQAFTQGARAVLFVPVKARWFALCFSGGHHMLDLEQCEDDFGLRVALNCLDPDEIKSSDVFMPSDHSKQKRTQTTRETNLEGHDFDGYTNILKNITGKAKPQYQHISKNVTASSSITINTDKSPADIDKLLEEVLDLYGKTDYEKNFPETTYINAVKNKALIGELDALLVDAVNAESDLVYLIIPELVNFAEIAKYDYSLKRKGSRARYTSVLITDLYQEIKDAAATVDLDFLKSKCLCLYDDNDKEAGDQPYSLYSAMVYDCQHKGNTYHFSHGKWYCVDKKFSDDLEKDISSTKKLPPHPFSLVSFDLANHKNENGYNSALATKNSAQLLDAKNIQISGYDKIEACDVLYKHENDQHYFIHVKRKHSGSQGMAHLFAQGDASLTLLANQNQAFIEGFKKISGLSEAEILSISNSQIHIVYLIIAENSAAQSSLPLFTKIALSRTLNSIKSKRAVGMWEFVGHTTNTGVTP